MGEGGSDTVWGTINDAFTDIGRDISRASQEFVGELSGTNKQRAKDADAALIRDERNARYQERLDKIAARRNRDLARSNGTIVGSNTSAGTGTTRGTGTLIPTDENDILGL